MPEFTAAFLKNCDVRCDVLSVFVAMKLRETVKIAKKLHVFFFLYSKTVYLHFREERQGIVLHGLK